MTIDSTQVSFSVAYGYEQLPQQLQLEELSHEARIGFWNAFYEEFIYAENTRLIQVIFDAHLHRFNGAMDEFPEIDYLPDSDYENYCMSYKPHFLEGTFNEIFDTLLFLMRHQRCPKNFKTSIGAVFERCQLAYSLDLADGPTIYPATTPEQGQSIVDAVQELNAAGLDGARQHLIQSSAFINQGEWAQSVHQSISAVESVARQIAPGTNTLGDALKQLKKQGLLEHPALHQGLEKLYGYTSDEQGVRHSLLDQGQSNVGQDEAVFMLGACASFASYLWRRGLGATS